MEAVVNQSNRAILEVSCADLGIPSDHPQWFWGIKCIKKYISQAAVMSNAEQQEMYNYIVSHEYDVDRRSVARDHKLYKKQMKMVEKYGKGSISWPIYLILSASYLCLPSGYEYLVRDAFGTSTVEDHTDEYLKATGTELEAALRTELSWSEFHASANWDLE
ncbi:hypothetical protein THARTR1_05725 [Trichoderma harzianum]|uniref:Uncharacterized protein n=1 Tax=Trichoderma harzianum TaxID=5544 RepID=A0A2K0U805_TRIHA|nr:hypothetical protein THARTR1_05725 [Trichoderma harzianum]